MEFTEAERNVIFQLWKDTKKPWDEVLIGFGLIIDARVRARSRTSPMTARSKWPRTN